LTPTTTSSEAAVSTPGQDLFIGQVLPAGTITELPSDQFIFLAFTSIPTPTADVRKRGENVARQRRPTVSPLVLVNLGSGSPGGIDQDNCDAASPLILQAGSLVQYGQAVAKSLLLGIAPFGFPTYATESNKTFSLNDGFLQWDNPDEGLATFYDCARVIVAAFVTPPGTPLDGCSQIQVGAIAGRACVDRVEQTRSPNATFVAPINVYNPVDNSSKTTK
jgi:hypothetical protein